MAHYKMYDEFAHLWTLISDPAEYVHEAGCWRDALRAEFGTGRHKILELGVGGGNNLSHLRDEFDATAVDLSEKMLANSMRLNPGVEHQVGDMRTVRLGRKFRAVLIHDAICYMTSESDLTKTFETVRAHLELGGIFLTAPDWFKETFTGSTTTHGVKRRGDIEVAFTEYCRDPDPTDTTIETVFVYQIREGSVPRFVEDVHITGLFPISTWERLMSEAGFEVEKLPYPVHEDGHEGILLLGRLL